MEPIYPPQGDEPNIDAELRAGVYSARNEKGDAVSPGAKLADAVSGRIDELIIVDGMTPGDATRQALSEITTDKPAPVNPVAKGFAFVLVTLVALAVLALALPVLGWLVGAVIMPLWHWGFGWTA